MNTLKSISDWYFDWGYLVAMVVMAFIGARCTPKGLLVTIAAYLLLTAPLCYARWCL